MGRGRRVLLVEDSDDDAELLERGLRRTDADWEIERVVDEAGFVAALPRRPDVIVSDLHLPRFSGAEALQIRNRLAPDIPFLVVSGQASDEAVSHLLAAGATDYLLKDRLSRLGEAVRRAADAADDEARRSAAETAARAAERRWRLVARSSALFVVVDAEFAIVYASAGAAELVGEDPQALTGRPALTWVHPDDAPALVEEVSQTLCRHDGLAGAASFRLRAADGTWRNIRAIVNDHLGDPLIQGVVIDGHDITEQVRAEARLALESRVLRMIARDHRFDDSVSMLLTSAAEYLGAPLAFVSDHPHLPDVADPPNELAARTAITSAGLTVGWVVMGPQLPTHGHDGNLLTLVEVLISVAAAHHLRQAELSHHLLHDAVTGLPNRHLLLDRTARVMAQRGHDTAAAIVCIGVDGIARAVDLLGVDAPDAVRRSVVEKIQPHLEPAETLAQVSPEEFAVLVESSCGHDAIVKRAERIVDALASEAITQGDRTIRLGVAAGIAFLEAGDTAVQSIENAVAALQQAARRSEPVLVFNEKVRIEVSERRRLERDLSLALRRGEFRCHLQPIVDLRGGAGVRSEALVRWERPGYGLLLAGQFMPVAERSELVAGIGTWMLDAACAHASGRRRIDDQYSVGVNVGLLQAAQPDFVDIVLDTIGRHGLPPSSVTLELTETELLERSSSVADALWALSDAGVRIAFDDFGTGFSSLSHVHQLPVDCLKIDRSFVHGLPDDDRSRAIVRMVSAAAEALGLDCVAEGIERPEQVEALLEVGVTLGQGFLFAPALPPAEFDRWAGERTGASQ